ncbi:MAG: cation-translocating P-type ATPase [Nitrospirota bacterium]
MKIHRLTTEEAFASLHSSPEGLTTTEAARRLAEFGANEVARVAQRPVVIRFAKGLIHFFALILWFAASLAFVAEWREPGQGMAALGWAIIGVIVVNGVFSFWQEYRAERAVLALRNLLPHRVRALRDRVVTEITTAALVPGDVILLGEGDDVPADCRVVEAVGARVNNATVTGESLPKARDARPSSEDDPLCANNVLLAGTSVVSGSARAVVFATGMRTAFGTIAHLTQTSGEALSPLQREIVRLSRVVAILAVTLGAAFFVIGWAIGLPFWVNFIFAIGIIVANVPEGLLPTVTLSLAMASQRMARRHALVRRLASVEALGCATVICTDKTGTLTQNRMAVKQAFVSGDSLDADGLVARARASPPARHVLEIARSCHDLTTVDRHGHAALVGDPMEIALVETARRAGLDVNHAQKVDEVPFDADRKRCSVLRRTTEGSVLYTKGAPETVLPLCDRVREGTAVLPFTDERRARVVRAVETMANRGLRVLAFADRPVPDSDDRADLEQRLILAGLVGLEDPPRPEVPDAIRTCRAAGIRVVMITGDHPHTALAIAREIDLVRSASPTVVTGDEIRRLSDTQLQLALVDPEVVFARVTADQKLRIVAAFQARKEIVAVTGDGVNDAPALKQADIGIAMGLAGTDVAREAADMVLLDDNFASIVAAVEEGRAVFDNIRKFLTYILTSNIPELVPYLAFALFKIPLPLTIIQILAVDLGTDMVPALALGAESPDHAVMRRPPRHRSARLLDRASLLRAYVFLGGLEAVAAMSAFFFVLTAGGWAYGDRLSAIDPLYRQATTACLSAIIVMQVVNVFACRHDRASALSFGLRTNPLILVGIATEIALILFIDYTPWGNLLFGTAPIPLGSWLFLIPFALGMFALEEGRKWIVRSHSWPRRARKP